MGPVIPIAGFFFLGGPEGAAAILGKGAPGFLFDAAVSIAHTLHSGSVLASFGILLLGILTGIDGSGFAGLPLVGATAGALGAGNVSYIGTLGAIGQIGAVWTGGGTLVAWSTLVAVAGISGVNAMELAKRNFIPVVTGMIVATVFALIFF
jgi:C4-dicarboxylate transporter